VRFRGGELTGPFLARVLLLRSRRLGVLPLLPLPVVLSSQRVCAAGRAYPGNLPVAVAADSFHAGPQRGTVACSRSCRLTARAWGLRPDVAREPTARSTAQCKLAIRQFEWSSSGLFSSSTNSSNGAAPQKEPAERDRHSRDRSAPGRCMAAYRDLAALLVLRAGSLEPTATRGRRPRRLHPGQPDLGTLGQPLTATGIRGCRSGAAVTTPDRKPLVAIGRCAAEIRPASGLSAR
jgi:hypothetical protein